MSSLRFFAAFAVAAVTAAALIIGVNAVIDPMGVVPVSPSLRGVNVEKVMRFNNDRIYKPLDLFSVRPRTVVLGTSRILQAFDPATLAGTPYAPAYNYGFAGGDLNELEGHFENFIARTPSVKHVFVELFLPAPRRKQPTPNAPELLAATFLSWSALLQSAETVWQNALLVRARRAIAGPIVRADGRQSFVDVSPVPNFLAYPRALLRTPPRYELNPWILGSMRRMRDLARDKGIALTFFISPVHAVQLYTLYVTGHWPVLEQWKRELAREFEVLDFSTYTQITEESVEEEMRYWIDPHHFSGRTANVLADRLVRREATPEGFGRPLIRDQLDDELRTWREARDRWIARNPAWVELFRLAREREDTGIPLVEGMPGGKKCPITVSKPLLSRLTPAQPNPLWIVASYRTTSDPPIAIGVRTAQSQDGGQEEACELAIEAAPETPSTRSVDWRIGHPMGSPAALRGRPIRYTVRVRATAPVTMSTGEIYVHDGVRTSVAPLTLVTPEWRAVTLEHAISPEASRLELWFRVVLGQGTVRPLGERIYFTASVDLSD